MGDNIANVSERTLDLMQFGNLSSVQRQEEHILAFNAQLEKLGLPQIKK